MTPLARWLALLACVAALCFAAVSCAAIGGLGDFQEVDCVGAACNGGSEGGGGEDGGADGTAADGPVESVEFATISGSVTGLMGTGLVLRQNGGDDLSIVKDGAFTFPAKVHTGDPYAVTVASQPIEPSQTCSVTNGSGTVNGANITNVVVTCSTAAYTVGGTVVGLSGGAGLILTNNGADDLAIGTSGGAFTFTKKVASGSTYLVAVKSQPSPGGPCAVSGGTGNVGVANVTGVVVNCAPGTYTVGGTISGLTGTVVLQNNAGNNLTLTSNGSFSFSGTLTPASAYAVTVLSQPGYPPRSQTCVVANGSGTMGSANVTNVAITCTTNTFTVGGNITGLTGTVVLKNNGGDNLTVAASGAFTFVTRIASGNGYAVTVGTQPSGQTCSVTSGSGTVTSANVTNVAVTCSAGSDPGILCGATHCNPATSLCCVTAGVPACAAKCTGASTVSITCDDAQDCATAGTPGLICCGSVSGTTVNSIYCTQPSLCMSPKAFYCDPGVANPCPNGGTCTPTTAPTGFYRCF